MQKRKTIRLADGYNGDTVLLFADPIETMGDTVKLQVAEPGRGYMFRWVTLAERDKAITRARNERANKARRERDQVRRDCGLVRVRGALGGIYWE